MKVFISGRIKHMPDYNKPAFISAEKLLTEHGHGVMNPIKLHPDNPLMFTERDYLHICFAMIRVCDFVYFLPGWEQSEGARIERDYAERIGKICCFNGFVL